MILPVIINLLIQIYPWRFKFRRNDGPQSHHLADRRGPFKSGKTKSDKAALAEVA